MSGTKKIIGIDLGTTNSCVAVIEGGSPVVIPNSEGMRTTPSIVCFDENNTRLVGLAAKRQAIKHPLRTVQSIKRFMGSNHRVHIDQMEFSPEQISACILQKLKLQAQQYLNEKVTRAIITVPAYFDDAQRLATRHAGEISGLEVVRVVNEPTACALAYGFNKLGQEANIVIFDFGGGTFDVTILQLCEGVLQVKATNGDNHLGGDDFDARVEHFLIEEFKKKYGIDLGSNPIARQRLAEAAEKAKIELSGMGSTQIQLPFLAYGSDQHPLHLETEIFLKEFNESTADLVQATAKPIERALKDARLTADQINHVVLVGGTTRIPAVQQFIRGFFNKEPVKSVNPDEAVALGAAIQGGILSGEIQEVLLLDVIPMTLGVEAPDGRFTRIIERNSTIPLSRTHSFATTSGGQSSVDVHVVQGENDLASQNTSLARFELTAIPSGPADSQKVEVVFDVDADGIFHCSVQHVGGQKKESIVLKRTTGYNHDEIERLKDEERERQLRETTSHQRLTAAVLAENSLKEAGRMLSKYGTNASAEQLQVIKELATKIRAALAQGDADSKELEELRESLEKSVYACVQVPS